MSNSMSKMDNKSNDGFIESLTSAFTEHCSDKGIIGSDCSRLARSLFDAISDSMNKALELSLIEAPNAVVEIIDKETGAMFRRYLELDFLETSNGIRLAGENSSGEPSSIVYLSGSAIERISEMQGEGALKPRSDNS